MPSHVRALAKSATVSLRNRLQRLNKHLPRWGQPKSGAPIVACCVYRSRNSSYVQQFVAQLPPGTDVRLHALDKVSPALADHTRSEGQGKRMPLLTRLIDSAPIPDDAWLVIFDDDATFARTGKTRFLDVALRAGFDISQPSIEPGQPHSYSFTLTRFLSVARRTRYVEVGPVVAFSPRGRAHALPFPADAEMGWGVDVAWSIEAQRTGIGLGIVDAEPILHHGAIAAGYDTGDEGHRAMMALAAAGLESMDALVVPVGPRWPVWRRDPPWIVGSDVGASR